MFARNFVESMSSSSSLGPDHIREELGMEREREDDGLLSSNVVGPSVGGAVGGGRAAVFRRSQHQTKKREEEGGLSLLDCEDSLLNLLLAPLHSRNMRGETAKVNSALAGEAGRI